MTLPDHPATKVLIVDDIAINLKIMAKALAPDYASEFAQSAEEALARLATGELPVLILLDVVMPGMDGYALCRQLKAEPRTSEIPVIFITARNDLEDELGAMLAYVAGGADFIHKPINPQVLRQRVRTQVQLRECGQALLRLEEELKRRACYDPVTGLPNRPLLLDRLHQRALERTRPPGADLLYVVLERFAAIGLILGPASRDRLLQQVAQRLSECVHQGDTVARFADGEFVVVMAERGQTGEAGTARALAETILTRLDQPYRLGDDDHQYRARIGIILTAPHQTAVEVLLRGAQCAMQQAEVAGHDAIRALDHTELAALAGDQGESRQADSPRSAQSRRVGPD